MRLPRGPECPKQAWGAHQQVAGGLQLRLCQRLGSQQRVRVAVKALRLVVHAVEHALSRPTPRLSSDIHTP